MSQYWESLAEKTNGANTPEEFEAAVYRLVVEQVLYHSDKNSKIAYWLVDQFENEFRRALAPLGIALIVNQQWRYACAIPHHAKMGTATVTQTLLALVLRSIYDETMRLGEITDEGEALCDLVSLGEKYRLITGRELPSKGDLAAALRVLKRWGIVRTSADEVSEEQLEGQRYALFIRPAIADILGEAALQRLALWSTSTEEIAADEVTVSEQAGAAQ